MEFVQMFWITSVMDVILMNYYDIDICKYRNLIFSLSISICLGNIFSLQVLDSYFSGTVCKYY